jgi:hypothetical protein
VEQHPVAGAQVAVAERGAGVVDGDDVTGAERVDAADRRDVEQQPPGDHLGQGVDAEPVGAVVLGDVGQSVPVVGAVTDLQVVEGVHVGAHLLGGGDLLDHPVDAVAAQALRPTAGAAAVDVMRVGRQVGPERAPGEGWDVGVQHVREVVHPPGAHQPDRGQDHVRRDLVERAGLVVGPPPGGEPAGRPSGRGRRRQRRHSEDQVVSNDGYSVRPPSMNSVWPVM